MDNQSTIPKMLTIDEAAREANMTYYAVRLLCVEGKVKAIKIGKQRQKWLINKESFCQFLRGE